MPSALCKKALDDIATVSHTVSLLETHSALLEANERKRLKVHNASSCVTRIYAVYERYVETALSDLLDEVSDLHPFAQLPESLRNNYRIGMSRILQNIDTNRYQHLDHRDTVRRYHEALAGNENYQIVSEALTYHDQNLRLADLIALSSRVGCFDLASWLQSAVAQTQWGDSGGNLDLRLTDFVQLRNDAAHGVLEDEIPGRDALLELCTFVGFLVRSLDDFLRHWLISERLRLGRAIKLGLVTERFKRANAIVVRADVGATFFVGMELHFLSAGRYARETVGTIQINGTPANAVTATAPGFEVGLGCTGSLVDTNTDVVVEVQSLLRDLLGLALVTPPGVEPVADGDLFSTSV